jgi:hypothetical protein
MHACGQISNNKWQNPNKSPVEIYLDIQMALNEYLDFELIEY